MQNRYGEKTRLASHAGSVPKKGRQRSSFGRFCWLLFFSLFAPLSGQDLPQQPHQPSTGQQSAIQDSAGQSQAEQQPSSKPPSGEKVETPITYEAQNVSSSLDSKTMLLSGRAKVSYQNMTLTAARILVDWDKEEIFAEGVLDTVWEPRPETADSVRVVKWTGPPEFREGGDVVTGESMVYSTRTRKGRVLRGRTSYEDGFYTGKAIKMVKSQTLNVSDARFTTCDKTDEPHFHFRSQKMKIEVNKKVVAKPLVFYIGRIPVFALPFIYFPIQHGRQSGLIIPRYGESTIEGRYLKGLGYYWAASDYWDVKGTMDFYEKSGFLFRGDLNYNIRYAMRGSISGSWTRKDFDISGTKERRWDLTVSHSQEISPTASFAVSGQFVSSGSFYKDLSLNRDQRLQQEIRSNATFTKKFGGSRSVTVNLNQTRDLKTDEVTETLPRISFRGGQFALIPKPASVKGSQAETRWYHSLYLSYSSNFLSQRSKKLDSSSDEGVFIKKQSTGWDHSLRFSSPQKVMRYFTVNPGVSYRETWFDKRKEYYLDPETNTITSRDDLGFFARRTFDMSVGLSTKIYGIMRPFFLPGAMLRHVATPNIGFSYRPDFSSEKFGTFTSVSDSNGVTKRYDPYSGSLFGSTPTGEQKAMTVSLQNVFQMKTGEADSARKIDLFTWNLGTSYNWKATRNRLADLSSVLRASPSKFLNLQFQSVHSFYTVDSDGVRTDRLFVEDMVLKDFKSLFRNWMRTTSLTASLDLRLRGKAKAAAAGQAAPAATEDVNNDLVNSLRTVPGDRFEMDEPVTSTSIPWDLRTSLNYTENRSNPFSPVKTFWTNASMNVSITRHWKISYAARLDLIKKEIVSQDLTIYRDLHCWEARIVWTPTGYYKRFYFRINIKSSMLQEIKLERGSGRSGLYGY
jgi:lipopolysaccharide assembly outer membrane protein LptD (OstA)